MKRRLAFTAAPLTLTGIALIAAGCGGGTGGSGYASATTPASGTAPAHAATLAVRHTALGNVIVDGQGRTLYVFEKDRGGASTCSGACASIWPPVAAGAKTVARGGLAAAELGS